MGPDQTGLIAGEVPASGGKKVPSMMTTEMRICTALTTLLKTSQMAA